MRTATPPGVRPPCRSRSSWPLRVSLTDSIRETLLRMVRGLSELRDPAAFRSWLVAITIRQVRDRERDPAVARHRSAGLEDAERIPDPALEALPYVQRHAWFGLGADPAGPSSGLFTDGTHTTPAGRAFQAAG